MRGAHAACAALLVLLCAAAGAGQLTNHPAAHDPLDGQGELPRDMDAADYEVDTRMVAFSLLDVDEQKSLASCYLYWQLAYFSPSSIAALMAPYTTCSTYCASRMSQTINSVGQPACCDNVFIPSATAVNTRGYAEQDFAGIRASGPISNTTVIFFRSFQGSFEYNFHYGSFPFDSHYILVDILTAFKPVLARSGNKTEGGGFSVVDGYAQEGTGSKLRAANNPANYRPDIRSKSLPAWDITGVFMEVVQLRRKFVQSGSSELLEYLSGREHADDRPDDGVFKPLPHGQWRGGQNAPYAVRLYIKVQRRTTGFWVMTCILPVALVTIFGFGVQSLPRQSLKARAELLSTIFLSLVLLQTVLYEFLPPFYFLALPMMLTLVGYLYTLLLFLVIIVSHAMEDRWRRRQLKVQRRWASQVFCMWAERLEQGPRAKDALAQSAARNTIPFPVTREQVMNPLQGARAKHKEGEDTKTAAAASDASRELTWIVKHRGSWWFRIPPIRFCVEWWKFTGLEGSQEYCHLMAHRFDEGARLALLATYICVVLALCLTTARSSNSQAEAPVFPQAAPVDPTL